MGIILNQNCQWFGFCNRDCDECRSLVTGDSWLRLWRQHSLTQLPGLPGHLAAPMFTHWPLIPHSPSHNECDATSHIPYLHPIMKFVKNIRNIISNDCFTYLDDPFSLNVKEDMSDSNQFIFWLLSLLSITKFSLMRLNLEWRRRQVVMSRNNASKMRQKDSVGRVSCPNRWFICPIKSLDFTIMFL